MEQGLKPVLSLPAPNLSMAVDKVPKKFPMSFKFNAGRGKRNRETEAATYFAGLVGKSKKHK